MHQSFLPNILQSFFANLIFLLPKFVKPDMLTWFLKLIRSVWDVSMPVCVCVCVCVLSLGCK